MSEALFAWSFAAKLNNKKRNTALPVCRVSLECLACIFQDGILVENMHDIPYVKRKDLSPEIVTMMTRICTEIRKVAPRDIACGVQV